MYSSFASFQTSQPPECRVLVSGEAPWPRRRYKELRQMEVEYRDIPGFPGYHIGNDGTVLSSWRGGCKKDGSQRTGDWHKLYQGLSGPNRDYPQVAIRCDRNKRVYRKVYRLVLEAFVGPCPEGMEACHNDGNPLNCRLDNLRWDTRKNNHADKIKHGTSNRGLQSPLSEDDVREIRKLLDSQSMSLAAIGRMFNVPWQTIRHIKHKETWAWLE